MTARDYLRKEGRIECGRERKVNEIDPLIGVASQSHVLEGDDDFQTL